MINNDYLFSAGDDGDNCSIQLCKSDKYDYEINIGERCWDSYKTYEDAFKQLLLILNRTFGNDLDNVLDNSKNNNVKKNINKYIPYNEDNFVELCHNIMTVDFDKINSRVICDLMNNGFVFVKTKRTFKNKYTEDGDLNNYYKQLIFWNEKYCCGVMTFENYKLLKKTCNLYLITDI